MIKKGSMIVVRPMKVVEVINGPHMSTVTVSVTYTNIFGESMKDEIVLPRKWVKEYKKEVKK